MGRLTEQTRKDAGGVSERLRRQLLWAFDATGQLDGDRFLVILHHEKISISVAEMLELASELTSSARTVVSRFIVSQN
jgi:hypothetical protein